MTNNILAFISIFLLFALNLNAEEAQRAPASYKVPKLQKASEALAPPPAITTDEAPSGEEDEFGWTGDWGGARTRLAEKGFTAALVYKGEWARVLKGGNETHTMHLNNIDLKLNIDAEKAFGWTGTSFFFYGISNTGADTGNTPTVYAGDRQGTSNIETGTNDTKLYEAWAQKVFADGKASLLLGLHDLNSEFYVTDSSGLFLNSSFGVGHELAQSGENGPSIFPNTSLAIRLRVEPSENFYLQTAAFNGLAGDRNHARGTAFRFGDHQDGLLLISEAGLLGTKECPAKYAIGQWSYTKAFDNLAGTNQTTVSGTYFLVVRLCMKT